MNQWISKARQLAGQMADELAKGSSANLASLAEMARQHATALAEAEKADAAGYAETNRMAEEVAALKARSDETIVRLGKLEKLGLAERDRRIVVMNADEIRALRKARQVFRYKDQAEGFGAFAAWSIYGRTGAFNDMVSEKARGLFREMSGQKDLDPGVSTHGAELVANLYMADLIAHVESEGVLFPLCDRVPLATTGSTIWPKLTGELTAYPTAVAATIQASDPTFTTVTLTPVKWGVRTPIPNEFFRNPSLLDALGQRVAWLITRAIAHAFDNALVNGDGTATYGNIMGLLHASSGLSTVAPASAQTLGAYTGADIGAVAVGLTVDYVRDPRWLMHLSSERTLRNIRSTVGTPLYERGSNAEPNTIDGWPYTTCQRFVPAASITTSTRWGAFGDLSLSHFFGMMGGIEIASSEHVQFNEDMTVLRGLAHAHAATKDASATVIMIAHS